MPDAMSGGTVSKLDIRDLFISYVDRSGQRVQAVDNLSLTVANKPGVGELAVFLGPSGCGKSTVLKAIAGLLEPDAGQIFIDGKEVGRSGRDRGIVFQSYTSFGWRTVRENVEYVGLQDFANAYPRQLSGGMKQRVAIARTLINRPKLVLMDEPFGALDPQTRWGMQSLILDVLRKLDNTVLFVTHDISEAV